MALRFRGLPHVLGYDTLNEPSAGYIGVAIWTPCLVRCGWGPPPVRTSRCSWGRAPRSIWIRGASGCWAFGASGTPAGQPGVAVRAWGEGSRCVWRENDVWSKGRRGRGRNCSGPDHFRHSSGGRGGGLPPDYYKPFAVRFANRIRRANPNSLVFLETEPGRPTSTTLGAGTIHPESSGRLTGTTGLPSSASVTHPGWDWTSATHGSWFGRDRVRRSFSNQLGAQRRGAAERLGGVPTLIGEMGVPFDLDENEPIEPAISATRRVRSTAACTPSRPISSRRPLGLHRRQHQRPR